MKPGAKATKCNQICFRNGAVLKLYVVSFHSNRILSTLSPYLRAGYGHDSYSMVAITFNSIAIGVGSLLISTVVRHG